jgi:hypothetical protein
MTKYNLKEFFKASGVDITDILEEPNILTLQILHLYFIIKDWYIKNKSIKIKLYNNLIENKQYINNQIDSNIISNLTNCNYCSIIYNETPIYSSIINKPILEYIENMYKENILYYAIYVATPDNKFIIFNYDYYKIILLIDISSLNITEFKSINDCIIFLDKISNNNYKYQILRIVKRLYSFD